MLAYMAKCSSKRKIMGRFSSNCTPPVFLYSKAPSRECNAGMHFLPARHISGRAFSIKIRVVNVFVV